MTVLAMPQFWLTVVTVLGASLFVLARRERARNLCHAFHRPTYPQTKAVIPVPFHPKE